MGAMRVQGQVQRTLGADRSIGGAVPANEGFVVPQPKLPAPLVAAFCYWQRPVGIQLQEISSLVHFEAVHVDAGDAIHGRLFSSDRGNVVASTAISDVWAEARAWALTPGQVASPLAGRPYDLRHAAVSLWLNAGVSPQDVAQRAGHSVEILLRVYAKCLHGGEVTANERIEAALNDA